MKTKTTGAPDESAPVKTLESRDKGTIRNLKYKILSFLNSESATAIFLNETFGTGDSRKYISDLRRDGHPIADYRLSDGSRRKVYFIHQNIAL